MKRHRKWRIIQTIAGLGCVYNLMTGAPELQAALVIIVFLVAMAAADVFEDQTR